MLPLSKFFASQMNLSLMIGNEEWSVCALWVCTCVQDGLNTDWIRWKHVLMHTFLSSMQPWHAGCSLADLLWEYQQCKPVVAWTSFYLSSAELALCKRRQSSEASRHPLWKLLAFLFCSEATFARTLCSRIVSLSVGLIWREDVSIGSSCDSLELGISVVDVQGSSRC